MKKNRFKRFNLSIRQWLIAFSTVQAILVIVAAVVIAWFTIPHRHRHHHKNHHAPPHHQCEQSSTRSSDNTPHQPEQCAPDKNQHHAENDDEEFDGRKIGPALTLLSTLLILLACGYFTSSRFLPIIEELRRTAHRLGEGNLDARADIDRNDEFGELARTLNHMASRQQSMIASERQMVANISHELRTPLARLRVALELLEEGSGDVHEVALPSIYQDIAEIESLLDDIFASARLQNTIGDGLLLPPESRKPIDPVNILNQAIRRCQMRYPQRDIHVQYIDPDLPIIEAHPILFRRALENILENAHKYSLNKSDRVEVYCQYDVARDLVVFKVLNTGYNFSEEERQMLMQPFYRAEHTSSTASGLGLGLALVKRIAEAHHGEISLEGREDTWTEVSLSIPPA